MLLSPDSALFNISLWFFNLCLFLSMPADLFLSLFLIYRHLFSFVRLSFSLISLSLCAYLIFPLAALVGTIPFSSSWSLAHSSELFNLRPINLDKLNERREPYFSMHALTVNIPSSLIPCGSLHTFLLCFEFIWQVHLINLAPVKIFQETIII